jgi:putative phosphoribosyl transferase
MYRDRADAGKQLAQLLRAVAGEKPIVLGLARGGVAIAYEIAAELKAPLAALVVRKIGAPFQRELALGALCDLGEIVCVFNEEILAACGLSPEDLAEDIARERAELARRSALFGKVGPVPDPKDRVVIVADDGIATGATARAALRALRAKGARRLILAAPCAAADSIAELRGEADEIVCPVIEAGFGAVGAYYRDFDQLTDRDVVDLLRQGRDEVRTS